MKTGSFPTGSPGTDSASSRAFLRACVLNSAGAQARRAAAAIPWATQSVSPIPR